MSPEFLKALELLEAPVVEATEYRLYYDNNGCITMLSERNHPSGDYIVIEDPSVFHTANTMFLRVVDGKLVTLSSQPKSYKGLERSNTGQRVVKGIAALALTDNEEYQDIEYYDRKTNN